jgi:hypothetical protein
MTTPKRGFGRERHPWLKAGIASLAVLGFAGGWAGFAAAHPPVEDDLVEAQRLEEAAPTAAAPPTATVGAATSPAQPSQATPPAAATPAQPASTPVPPAQSASTPTAAPSKPEESATRAPRKSRGS